MPSRRAARCTHGSVLRCVGRLHVRPDSSYGEAGVQPFSIALAEKSAFPVYLPSLRSLSALAPYLDIVENVPYKYDVQLARFQDCSGRPICAVGELVGHQTHDATTPLLQGTRVRLRDGGTAFWTAHDCAYLGCNYGALTFELHGHYYEVALINGSMNTVRALANSMSAVE